MQHNDIGRTGQNTSETVLTPANVNSTTFGRLFTLPTDGQIYAQPLYLQGVAITGHGTHNVVFIATEHDSVYAIDGDTGGTPLWQVSFLVNGATTVPSSVVGAGDIYPQIGITGTPVIDTNTKTLYVVAETLEGGLCVHRLHALDITSGAEKFGGPVILQASAAGTGSGSANGTLVFNSLVENQRPGLLLLNGYLYIGFAAHGDNGFWHGWILSYNAATLKQVGAWTSSPNGIGSGFWASGSGLAADTVNGGRLFVSTGNGDFPVPSNVVPNPAPAPSASVDYGDSIVQLAITNGQIVPTDYFTPYNTSSLDAADTDLGSGGVLIPPIQTGTSPDVLVQAGKQGRIYVLNRDKLTSDGSHFCNGCTSDPEILQTVTGIGGLWSMPAYWNGNIYFWGNSDRLKSYTFANGKLSASPTSESAESSAFPGSTPTVSANGTTNGIVWTVQSDGYSSRLPAILRAYNATNVSNLLYASNLTSGRDALGAAAKFATPTVVNGKVYVGTSTELDAFGILGSEPQTAAPVFAPAGGSYSSGVTVALSDTTPGASIYYTTDGSAPTLASTKYSTGIPIQATSTVNAIAVANGFLQSATANATYTVGSQTQAPQFTPVPGAYSGSQTITISDASRSPTIYYTTNGTTPTHSSSVYTAPITVSSTTTITAIASSSGLVDSAPTSGTYTITASGSTTINFALGFSNDTGMKLNGTTDLDDSRLQLTNGGINQAGSAFYTTPIDVRNFTTDFSFQLSNAKADGITFTIQRSSAGASALGGSGGNLGYGTGANAIGNSMAIKFDIFSNDGEGENSTGLYENAASPMLPAIDLTSSGIELNNGDTIAAHVTYDGTTLTMALTDDVLNATFTHSWPINIPTTIGGNLAYAGFTGGTGGLSSSQKIETWTFVSTPPQAPAAATPTITPGTETFTGSVSVALSDVTSGAAIYYTTDGSMPKPGTGTTLLYGAPFTVGSTKTVNAVATASLFSTSAQVTAVYTQQAVAAPTITPNGGSITTTQMISISDVLAAATIYYTTDGTTPAPGAGTTKQYAGAFTLAASATVKAVAASTGYANSFVATAAFTILQPTPAPAVNPAAGTYTGTVSVSITDTITGAAIYYTTDGTTPSPGVGTTRQYSSAISLTSSATVRAIAIAPSDAPSAVTSAAYVVQPLNGITAYGAGFTTTSGLQLNGSAKWNQAAARVALTNGVANQAGSFFATAPVNVQSFTTNFSFQLSNANSDGFTFTIQNNSVTGVGSTGGQLGYAVASGVTSVFTRSVAVKFDLHSNSGEGSDSTGVYLNGASPIVPAVDMTNSGVNLHSGDVFNVTMKYDGSWLQMTITDSTTHQSFTDSWPVNIPSALAASTAYVGFTGATGGGTAAQEILNWTFTPGMPSMKDPLQFQTVNLMNQSVSSGPTYAVQPWTGYVSGTGTGLSATKAGDSVTITLNVPVAGTYDVKFASKNFVPRGTSQLSVNGVNVGAAANEYSALTSALWYEFDLGTVTLAAGSQPFKFTVTGKSAASTGYALAFEYIKLTPQ